MDISSPFSDDDPSALSPSGNWPIQDIIYVSVVGTVMLAACLEWFLWLAAFEYSLVKCFQKADRISVKILAVVMMILFFALRYMRGRINNIFVANLT